MFKLLKRRVFIIFAFIAPKKMKYLLIFSLFICFICGFSHAPEKKDKEEIKILLLLSEQNTQGLSISWWKQGSDLSTIESNLTKLLQDSGYQSINPSAVYNAIKIEKALHVINLEDREPLRLGKRAGADYIVIGKANASSGRNIAGLNLRSCYANAAVKLIKVKDGSVVAYLDAMGTSLSADITIGCKEALTNTAVDLAAKIISHLTKEGGT